MEIPRVAVRLLDLQRSLRLTANPYLAREVLRAAFLSLVALPCRTGAVFVSDSGVIADATHGDRAALVACADVVKAVSAAIEARLALLPCPAWKATALSNWAKAASALGASLERNSLRLQCRSSGLTAEATVELEGASLVTCARIPLLGTRLVESSVTAEEIGRSLSIPNCRISLGPSELVVVRTGLLADETALVELLQCSLALGKGIVAGAGPYR
jgi:hypothetical protein